MNRALLLLLTLLLAVGATSAADTYYYAPTGATYGTSAAYAGIIGGNVTINTTVTEIRVQKISTATATTSYILNSSGHVLSYKPFTSNNATHTVTLEPGYYYIGTSSNGSARVQKEDLGYAGSSFAIGEWEPAGFYCASTSGTSCLTGINNNNKIFDIVSVTFGVTASNSTSATLTLINAYNGSSITTFNATINGTTYTTTNGTIVTNISTNTTSLYDITFTAASYFSNTSTNVNLSSGSYEGSVTQAWVRFSCFERYTNDSLDCDEADQYPRNAGTYTDTVNATGYFSNPTSYNLTALTSRTMLANYSWEGSWLNPKDIIAGPGEGTGAYPTTDGTSYFYFNTSNVSGAYTRIVTSAGIINQSGGCNAVQPYQGRVRSLKNSAGGSGVWLECYTGSSWSILGGISSAAYTSPPTVRQLSYAGNYFAVESTGFYDFLLNITALDFRGTFLEENFNVNLSNAELGINFTNSSGDCGCNASAAFELLMGYNYSVSVEATDTLYSDPIDAIAFANITNVTSSPPETYNYQFNLTAARTINLAYYWEDNLSVFTENVTAFFIPTDDFNNLFFTSTTTNGTSTINNIPVGSYIVQMLVNPAEVDGPPGLGGDSEGYHNEERFIILSTFSSANLTGYFRVNTTGEHKDFQVYDENNNAPNGWIIRAQRYYNGTGWITVDEGRTNIDGLSDINLLSDEYYKIILYNESFGLKYASERTLLPSLTYTLTPSTSTVIYDYVNTTTGVSSGIAVLTADNGSLYFRGDVSSSAGAQTWRLNVYREYSNNRVLVATTQSTTTAGSLIAFIPNTTGRYTATVSVGSTTVDNAEYTIGGFKDAIGAGGAVYAFLLMIGMIGIGIFSAPTAIILGVISLIVAGISGLFYVGWSALIGFAIVGGMIIMRRER